MPITNVTYVTGVVKYLIKNLVNFIIVMNSVINFYIDSTDTDLDGEN
jgi:predicted nucleotidyltransferase